MRANRHPIHNLRLRQKKWGCQPEEKTANLGRVGLLHKFGDMRIVIGSNGELALGYNALTGHLQRLRLHMNFV